MATNPTTTAVSGERRQSAKVIFVNRFFYPDQSATSQLLTDLCSHLAKSGRSTVVVTAQSPDGTKGRLARREYVGTVEVRRVRTALTKGSSVLSKLMQYLSFYPGAFFELLRLAKPRDLIVAKTDPPLISVVAVAAAKCKRARVINWIQDLYPEVASELQTPLLKGFIGQVLAHIRNWSLSKAELNVAIGSQMAKRVCELGTPVEKVTVIHNWADETAITPVPPERSAARRRWNLEPSQFVVGYSGNLGHAHEVETLVGAACILRDRHDIRFLFVGGGRQHDRLNFLIASKRLKSFTFKPQQPRELLSDSLAAADVHWVSLRPELEGLVVPSKLYGVLAAGRPVVAVCGQEGEISRMVREHGCGIVVEPGDSQSLAAAIMLLSDDRDLRTTMGRRARNAAVRFYSKQAALRSWSTILST